MQKSEKTLEADETAPGRGRGRPRAFDREAALAQAMRLFWRDWRGGLSRRGG